MSAGASPADAAPSGGEPWWADLGERLAPPASTGDGPVGPGPGAARPGRPADAAKAAEHAEPAAEDRPERAVVGGLPHLPDAAWIAAMLLLDDMGPVRLANLLRSFGAQGAWRRVLDGSLGVRPELAGRLNGRSWDAMLATWQRQARLVDVAGFWARHEEAAVGVTVHGGPSFPRALVDDPEPPAVLFHAGDPGCIAGPRAAVVGTRRCSERGRRFAEELGFALSRAGVGVVSGLARGIDGAAHRGALRAAERGGAPPIGVVASGLDVVYPHEHAELWARVAQTGVLLSEVPLGVRPNRWRFPARNRVIAGLADVLVVVESPAKGGSMYTVEEAMRRNVPVLAVPGAVGLRAGEGTNALIFDGAGVARDAADVLLELGLAEEAPAAREADSRPVPSPEGSRLLDAVAWQPVTLAGLVGRLDWSVGDVAEALTELRDAGWIAQAGAWFERIAR